MRIIDIDDPKTWGPHRKVSNCKYWDKRTGAWVYELCREVRGKPYTIQVMIYRNFDRWIAAQMLRKARHQMRSIVLANS